MKKRGVQVTVQGTACCCGCKKEAPMKVTLLASQVLSEASGAYMRLIDYVPPTGWFVAVSPTTWGEDEVGRLLCPNCGVDRPRLAGEEKRVWREEFKRQLAHCPWDKDRAGQFADDAVYRRRATERATERALSQEHVDG